jgi:hypothetical protein
MFDPPRQSAGAALEAGDHHGDQHGDRDGDSTARARNGFIDRPA